MANEIPTGNDRRARPGREHDFSITHVSKKDTTRNDHREIVVGFQHLNRFDWAVTLIYCLMMTGARLLDFPGLVIRATCLDVMTIRWPCCIRLHALVHAALCDRGANGRPLLTCAVSSAFGLMYFPGGRATPPCRMTDVVT
jgi:hypothetical protein